VDHGGPRELDGLRAGEDAGLVHDVGAEERRPEDVDAEEEELAGVGVDLGVGGHR